MSTLSKSSLFWISPEQSTINETKLTELSSLISAYTVKSATKSSNLLMLGNRYTYSRIKKFETGGAYLQKSGESVQVKYARSGSLTYDGGRLKCPFTERFGITGLNGFWQPGNGNYTMTTFFRNSRPVYLNPNRWAVWHDPNMESWVMTETLNLHPAKQNYSYLLSNGDTNNPDGGLYSASGTGQSGYGPNSVRERVIISAPTDSYESPVRKISTCDTHTAFLDENDNGWTVGSNQFKQLGDNTTKSSLLPSRASRGDVADISTAHGRTFITKVDGSLWVVGKNSSGQAGVRNIRRNLVERTVNDVTYGLYDDVPSLIKIAGGGEDGIVLSVKGSTNHTLFLKYEDNDGVKRKNLYALGTNQYGQLATGNYYGNTWGTSTPELIASDSVRNEILFDTGVHFSMWVRQGTLYGAGRCGKYEVGGKNTSNQYYLEPFVVSAFGRTDCKKVGCGQGNSVALLEDGTLWATGMNTYGQNGLSSSVQPPHLAGFTRIASGVKDMSVGYYHMIVLMQDGRLLSAGSNQFGQCATERPLATINYKSPGHSNTGLRGCVVDGELVTSGVSYIHAGGNSTFFVKDDKLYACGYNVLGNLGDGSNDNLRYVTKIYPTG